MKKISSIIIALILSAFMMCTAYAAEKPGFVVSSTDAKAGEKVEIKISVNNNPGLTSMKFAVSFDPTLTLEKVEYNSAFSGQTLQPSSMSSPVTLIWISPFENVSQNGTFATLTFTVDSSAHNGDVADIVLTYDPNDVYNLKEENVNFAVTNGKINIFTGSGSVGCSHINKTKVNAKDSTCTEKGWDDYYVCNDCGQTFLNDGVSEVTTRPFRPLTSHTGGTATCNKKAICTVCGNSYGSLNSHNYSDQIKKEAAIKNSATCQNKAEYYYSCSVCGAVEKNDNHIFYGPTISHSFTKYISDGNATTEADGTKTAKCDYCNETDTVVDIGSMITSDHKHSFSTAYKISSNEHWKVCACGAVAEKNKHTFGELIVEKEATETTTGVKKQICKICLYEKISDISKISHNSNASIKVAGAKTVDYRSNVTIVATASGVDSGYHLEIVVGNKVYKGTNTEVKADLGEIKSDINYQVKVVKDDGGIQNNLTTEGGKITCNSSFFKRVVAFFKGIFSKLPVVTIKP